MLGLFGSSKKYDLAWLGVDIHNHLLPGIDDGCVDMETAIQCLKGLSSLGLHTLYCTPHIFPGRYPNTRGDILNAFVALQSEAARLPLATPPLRLNYAAEYMLDEGFPEREAPSERLLLGRRNLLVELPYAAEPLYAESYLFQLLTQGVQPILAHPERHVYHHRNREQIKRYADLGCHLQVNLLSLAGYYGLDAKRTALWMVREFIVDYVATDLHHPQHLQALQRYCWRTDTEKLLRHNPIKNRLLAPMETKKIEENIHG